MEKVIGVFMYFLSLFYVIVQHCGTLFKIWNSIVAVFLSDVVRLLLVSGSIHALINLFYSFVQ